MNDLTSPITPELLERLVDEAALGYYTPKQIAAEIGLPAEVVGAYLEMPPIISLIDKAKRNVVESGEKFRLTCRQLAVEVLPEVAKIAMDEDNKPKDRLAAATFLAKQGDLTPTPAPAPTPVQINQHFGDRVSRAISHADEILATDRPYLDVIEAPE